MIRVSVFKSLLTLKGEHEMIVKKRLLPILVAVLVVFALIPMRAQNVYAAETGGLMFDLNDLELLSGMHNNMLPEHFVY